MSQKPEALQNKMTELMVRTPAKAEFHLRPFGSQFFIKSLDFFHLRPCTILSKYCVSRNFLHSTYNQKVVLWGSCAIFILGL